MHVIIQGIDDLDQFAHIERLTSFKYGKEIHLERGTLSTWMLKLEQQDNCVSHEEIMFKISLIIKLVLEISELSTTLESLELSC
jgi:hypothetical protein